MSARVGCFRDKKLPAPNMSLTGFELRQWDALSRELNQKWINSFKWIAWRPCNVSTTWNIICDRYITLWYKHVIPCIWDMKLCLHGGESQQVSDCPKSCDNEIFNIFQSLSQHKISAYLVDLLPTWSYCSLLGLGTPATKNWLLAAGDFSISSQWHAKLRAKRWT